MVHKPTGTTNTLIELHFPSAKGPPSGTSTGLQGSGVARGRPDRHVPTLLLPAQLVN